MGQLCLSVSEQLAGSILLSTPKGAQTKGSRSFLLKLLVQSTLQMLQEASP